MEHVIFSSNRDQKIARNAAAYHYGPGYKWTYADLDEAYVTGGSVYKRRAERYCWDLCHKLHGYDFRIAAANTFTFSVLFKFMDPDTGRECVAYITRDHDRFAYLTEAATAAPSAAEVA